MEWVKSKTPRQQPPACLVCTLRLLGVDGGSASDPAPASARRSPEVRPPSAETGHTDHSNILSDGGRWWWQQSTCQVSGVECSMKSRLLNVKALPNGPISLFGSDAIYSTHNIFSEATLLMCSKNCYPRQFSIYEAFCVFYYIHHFHIKSGEHG